MDKVVNKNKEVIPLVMMVIDASMLEDVSWIPFSDTGFEGDVFSFKITNSSNTEIYVSFDGSEAHDYIEPNSITTYDFSDGRMISKGTKIYINGEPGIGEIFISGFYDNSSI